MNDLLDPFFNLNSANAVAALATTFIYGLNCPVTGKCRYVGKADDPQERFKGHLFGVRKSSTYKNCWIRGLAAQGLKPVLEVLDEVPVSEWEFWEREYIRVFRMIGFNLTNLTDGGDGGAIRFGKHSPETCAKISVANFGKKFSPEHRAKLKVSKIGKKRSPEICAKVGAAHRGKKRSPETCAKISAAQIGKKRSPETCAKLRAANLGKKMSPEACAKISAANLGRNLSEETKLKRSEALKAAWKAGKFSARNPRRNRG